MAIGKETAELFNLAFQVYTQFGEAVNDEGGWETRDDLPKFFDEVFSIPTAVTGLKEIGVEASAASKQDIEDYFNPKITLLTDQGVNAHWAYVIINAAKTLFSIYVARKREIAAAFAAGKRSAGSAVQ